MEHYQDPLALGISLFGNLCHTYNDILKVFDIPDVRESNPDLFDAFVKLFRNLPPLYSKFFQLLLKFSAHMHRDRYPFCWKCVRRIQTWIYPPSGDTFFLSNYGTSQNQIRLSLQG